MFDGCSIARFGYPNDEALAGHPPYARGLQRYGCFEVLNSTWRSQLKAQNEVTFPNSEGLFNERHFVITFTDSTFECLADDMRWVSVKGSNWKALRPLLPRY